MKIGISTDVAQRFRTWFERNLVGMRSGRLGDIDYRRAGALDDIPGDDIWYANAYDRAVLDYTESTTPAEEDYIRSHPLIVLQLILGLTDIRAIRCMRRGLTRRINMLQQKAYRSRYYEKDNRRRRILAAERRKIHHRTTLNHCPTADEFRSAFAARNDSVEARIRFGGMVHDLECYVDNCLRINENGEIIGRNGGIKHWLADNVPELYESYKNIMRYKALVKRIRQATRVRDPIPTSALLDGAISLDGAASLDGIASLDGAASLDGTAPLNETASLDGRTQEPMRDASDKCGARRIVGDKDYYALKSRRRIVEEAAKTVKGMLAGCDNTMAGVFRVVDGYLDKHFDELFNAVQVGKRGTGSVVRHPL